MQSKLFYTQRKCIRIVVEGLLTQYLEGQRNKVNYKLKSQVARDCLGEILRYNSYGRLVGERPRWLVSLGFGVPRHCSVSFSGSEDEAFLSDL